MAGLKRGRIRQFLSLRWQAFCALALTLTLSNLLIGVVAYRDAMSQFDLQQSLRRDDNTRLLHSLLAGEQDNLASLIDLLPLLGPEQAGSTADSPADALRAALGRHGAVLAMDWDVAAVHWVDQTGNTGMTWPTPTPAPLTADLSAQLIPGPDEQRSLRRTLHCAQACFQYLSAPMLWQGREAGTLVLARSLADALLRFHTLTGADVAIAAAGPLAGAALSFKAMTNSSIVQPVLEAIAAPPVQAGTPTASATPGPPRETHSRAAAGPVSGQVNDRWYEIHALSELPPHLRVLIIDDVSAARAVVRDAARNSLLIGTVGLLFSGLVLVWLANAPLRRLQHIVSALPLLAEGRYRDLRARLQDTRWRWQPQDELELLRRTTRTLAARMQRVEQDRRRAARQLSWLGNHDPLTHLHNRNGFMSALQGVVDHTTRYGHQGALLLLDIDDFKEFNDVHGHQFGDQLLVAVGIRLRSTLRPSDVLGRLSADEFAVALPQSSAKEALECAQRIQRDISHSSELEAAAQKVTLSIGITQFPSNANDSDELMTQANLALHQARQLGMSAIHLFSAQDALRGDFSERAQWRRRINEALAEQRLQLYFQPVVHIRGGGLHHFESLLRMRDTNGDLVMPQQFIPIAEQTGQILEIDDWVIREAVDYLARDSQLRLSINLSAKTLQRGTIVRSIPELLQRKCVSPDRLILEVTETIAMQSLTEAGDIMQQMSRQGCSFALDDFGSGYASYAYLRQLPVTEVKIDGAFIRNITTNRDDQVFVKSITEMLRGLGKSVVAEFVETEEIYTLLAELGVELAQGYLLGRPQPEPVYRPRPIAPAN